MVTDEVVFLSRRNLLALLAKLDANVENPGVSQCAIVKYQSNLNEPFRQSMEAVTVVAVEDEVYYTTLQRSAGQMHEREEAKLPKPSTGVEYVG